MSDLSRSKADLLSLGIAAGVLPTAVGTSLELSVEPHLIAGGDELPALSASVGQIFDSRDAATSGHAATVAVPPVELPAGTVAQCASCLRFLRLRFYLRCRECRATTCKGDKCYGLHQAAHRAGTIRSTE